MPPLLMVALGGAVGSVARYLLAGALNPGVATGPLPQGVSGWALFPAGTFAVNLIGCAAIGLIAGWLGVGGPEAAEAAPHALWRPLLVAGVLGGFTTFSAFGLETLLLVRAGLFLPAAIYVVGSVGVGLMLSAGGYALTGRQ